MHIPKGGRGIKVPYNSKVVRVPEPILGEVQKLIDGFYSEISLDSNRMVEAGEAITKAREILDQNKISKRSTKICLEKLLQFLYSDNTINL